MTVTRVHPSMVSTVVVDLVTDVAAASTDLTTLVVVDEQAVAADLTIPATIHLKVEAGGSINPAAGKTVTINGTIEAGAYQIFGGSGTVTIGTTVTHIELIEWYGVTTLALALIGALSVSGAVTLSDVLGVTGITTLSDDVKVAALKKIYLDGGGNTYIVESAADTFDVYAGGVKIVTLTATTLTSLALSCTTGAFSDDVTIATAKALNIGTEQVVAEAVKNGINCKRTARIAFDYSDQTGSGAWDSGVTLPDNAVITRAWYDVTATFGGDGDDSSTIAISVEGANDIVTATAISAGGNIFDAGIHDAIPQGDDPSTFIKTTQARNVTVTVAINATDTALDEGSMVIFIEYVVSD